MPVLANLHGDTVPRRSFKRFLLSGNAISVHLFCLTLIVLLSISLLTGDAQPDYALGLAFAIVVYPILLLLVWWSDRADETAAIQQFDPPLPTNADDVNDSLRVYAESCILHFLGQLHGEAERRLREVDAKTMRLGDRWLDVFLGDWSIPTSAIEFIQKQWEKEKAEAPEISAQEFACRWAGPLFSPWTPLN